MNKWPRVIVAGASVLVCGCRFSLPGAHPQQPVGQVVATVDGKEITVRQLQAELAGAHFANAQAQKAGEQRAVQTMIARTALADAARKQGLDKAPEFEVEKDRAIDNLLAQAYERKIASDVPAPTREEAQSYVTAHPELFGEHKIYTIDQIRAPNPNDPTFGKQLAPLKTMSDVATFLNSKHIPFSRAPQQLDLLALDPRVAQAILKLPPQEVFIFGSGPYLYISQIQSAQDAPITGDKATNVAMALLQRQHAQEAVSRAIKATLDQAGKTVQLNKAYAAQSKPATPASATK